MVTITLLDRDALALYAVVTEARSRTTTPETLYAVDAALRELRCALLLCDCDAPKTTFHRSPDRTETPA